MKKKRLIVGVSGASGIQLAMSLLEELKKTDIEIHFTMSDSAIKTYELETHKTISELTQLVDVFYNNDDISCSIASGSFDTLGMIIIPCSMKTLAALRSGYSDSLLTRAADVCIKEKRPLILVPRESPLSPIHLENMHYLSQLQNVMIVPPMLTYYHQPITIQDMEKQLIGKILRYVHIESDCLYEWNSSGH